MPDTAPIAPHPLADAVPAQRGAPSGPIPAAPVPAARASSGQAPAATPAPAVASERRLAFVWAMFGALAGCAMFGLVLLVLFLAAA